MDDELRFHVECETAERIRAGQSPEDARRAALQDFGGVERIKEEGRDARGGRAIEDLLGDLRYSLRVLRRHRGFATAAILTLTLGIGAAGAIFSVVYGVLLRPLPYADPARLVVVWERNIRRNTDRNVVSVGNFEAWRNRSDVFDGMAALVPRPVTLVDGATADRINGAEVSAGYFRLLGIVPLLGRGFDSVDTTTAPNVVVLSHAFWRRRFAADPAIVGRTLRFSEKPYTVVGVMPASFEPPKFNWLGAQDVWFPFVATPENRAWGRFLLVVARMKPGVSLGRARAAMTALGEQMSNETAGNAGWGASIVPLADQITGDVRTALVVILGAVGLLLLIAIANVSTLTLSLMQKRGQELATRRSLGASDGRLVRQLMTEGALVAVCGTASGLALMSPLVGAILRFAPADVPRAESIRVDAPVVLVAAAIALGATIVFAALAAARGRTAAIWHNLRGDADARSSFLFSGSALVAGEIAVALALTVMATLMVRSFISLRAVVSRFCCGWCVGGSRLRDRRAVRLPDQSADIFRDAAGAHAEHPWRDVGESHQHPSAWRARAGNGGE